jgi:hypothetical protein
MITRKELEQRLRKLKPYLAETYNVDKIAYFGSFATGGHNKQSDLDILVELNKPLGWEFFDLQELLEKELETKVDLVSVKALKEQIRDVILNQARYI